MLPWSGHGNGPAEYSFDVFLQSFQGIGFSVHEQDALWSPREAAQPANDISEVGMSGVIGHELDSGAHGNFLAGNLDGRRTSTGAALLQIGDQSLTERAGALIAHEDDGVLPPRQTTLEMLHDATTGSHTA